MPYIKGSRKERLKVYINFLVEEITLDPQSIAGEVNFIITSILTRVFAHKHMRYKDINEAMGVIECVKQEFYRRVAAEYEDKAKAKNGDVYPDREE